MRIIRSRKQQILKIGLKHLLWAGTAGIVLVTSVEEDEVKANADYMAKHLKDFGWEYIVVDIRWYADNQTTGHYNKYDETDFIIDEYGRYMPSPKRFPSSVNGAGFKPLADYIHSLGLKFGIHIMRGVPKEAVFNKLPIKGIDKTAADIYSTEFECTWLQDNYTVVKDKPGAQEYYNSIFDMYASWGLDFVKVDDLSRPYHADEIEMIRKAIDQTGRPIVLSMSPGATPIDKHEHATANANMWRTIDDFWDNWAQLNYSFDKCAEWAPYITPGAWYQMPICYQWGNLFEVNVLLIATPSLPKMNNLL
ncbi:glycoside hydrolase family 27 protein [Thalassobellus suaedae]|uniref:Glycoside hydrolase family 27 protein n=1 Tax=Thalassobellus suaedae TaxID=3074124 RepID=A0ABY9XXC4_9FLAO|nr:glycoside hydrolase family 27 protein [Flavobacteriaceae bacterium HL-DH14]